jgi:hypothetical protein
MQNPRIVLVGMCGDLAEDFRNMCDRRKNYNRPLEMRRSEMGVRVVGSRKEKSEDLPGHQRGWGMFSQGQKEQSDQG